MRGGRFEQKKGDGNVRNAETLLQSRSVAEVREVEAATRQEIREKQEELRQLVGASYRDLIDSADSIVLMANCCDCILANLAAMSQGVDTISAGMDTTTTGGTGGTDSGGMGRREELYGMGSRVKYLVDTPEKIWGCLDEHMYLEAAERYLRARQVHTLLLLHTNAAAATHFPLLRHQWPLVDTFHAQISARARERLLDTALSPSDYAVALAAIAIVENLSSAHLFSLFIDTRKAWLRNLLVHRASDSAAAALLCNAVDLIHLTLCHIGQLFLEVSGGSPPLLFATILTAPPSSQLFGGLLNPDKEVAAWKLHREKLEASMVPLSADFVAEGGLSFLSVCAQELSVETQPMFSAVVSGKQLAVFEEAVRLHIDKQAVLYDSLDWLHCAFGRVVNSPWDFLSTLLLKRSVNLWESLFESIFVVRVKAIVDLHVSGISILHMVDEQLLKSLETSACFLQPRLGLVRSLLTDKSGENGRRTPIKNREWLGEVRLYFGPEVCRIQEVVDDGFKTVLEDLLLSLAGSQRFSSRIAELGPFMHGRVMSCMSNICKELGARLALCLEGSTPSPDGLVNVERALFLGRLALSLGQHLRFLPVILGPSERWRDDTSSSLKDHGHFLARRNSWSDRCDGKSMIGLWSPKPDQTSQLLSRLQAELSSLWDVAHDLWVTWSTDMLVQMFSRDLNADDSFSATTLSKGWEETVIKQDNAEVEIKITLPVTASPSAVGLLIVANQEIYRVGGHVLDKALVHSFATKLLEKVLTTYDSYVANGCNISERGSLQLLFDVKFVASVLNGLQEDLEKTRSQSGAKVRTLLSALSNNLDPIDWATYEAQLWENEQRSYQRCAVLFGFLTQLNRLQSDFGVNQSSTAITMDLSTSERLRFGTLPISMPVIGDGGGASNRETNGGGIEGRKGSADEERFAFDDDESRGVTSLPSLKSLMGQVGSKIGEGTLKFGSSIIGDGQVGRLRDTAMSTFGEMLPSLDAWN